MDIEQEAKDLCEQCQNGASVSDVMEIVGRIAEQAVAEALVSVSHAVATEHWEWVRGKLRGRHTDAL